MADTLIPLTKRCGRCGEDKQDTKFSFVQKRLKPGKRSSFCKSCAINITRAHNQQQREAIMSAEPWTQWFYVDSATYLRAHESRSGLRNKFGLTITQYCEMVEGRRNTCDICGKSQGGINLAVDHCHETGRIRGLLCNACNLGLGKLGDTLEAVERALNYLREAA